MTGGRKMAAWRWAASAAALAALCLPFGLAQGQRRENSHAGSPAAVPASKGGAAAAGPSQCAAWSAALPQRIAAGACLRRVPRPLRQCAKAGAASLFRLGVSRPRRARDRLIPATGRPTTRPPVTCNRGWTRTAMCPWPTRSRCCATIPASGACPRASSSA